MQEWLRHMKSAGKKKAMPILSFPSVSLMGITVKELISSAEKQAEGMHLTARRTPAAAAVSMMDLSVEAEAFGAQAAFSEWEVPTVCGRLIQNENDAFTLQVPAAGAGRTGLYIDAIGRASKLIKDRPVFAGVIGPFSLAGRLIDVSEAMLWCYDAPEALHAVLQKCARFLESYILKYKAAGAQGVVMAEPLAGLLTPAQNAEFSSRYIKEIIAKTRSENFIIIYHNCGGGTPRMTDEIFSNGADAYHFGNSIELEDMLKKAPPDKLVMGNIDPAGVFCNGTPQSMRKAVFELLEKCAKYPNFAISSGCDIPPKSRWENIDAFFAAVDDFRA